MPQEHLLQVSPEIAANEMLLKEHLETTKFLKGDSACFHFKTFY
jgi:hypothetical protein